MTPKEKANKLANNFVFKSAFDMNNDELKEARIKAKQCALICVDEIIFAVGNFGYAGSMFDDFETGTITTTNDVDPCLYWREVKKEIEKL